LGLLLFSKFMNDLEDEISSNVLKFADEDNKDCGILQSDLAKLVSWSQNGIWTLMLKMQSNAGRRTAYKMVLQHGG